MKVIIALLLIAAAVAYIPTFPDIHTLIKDIEQEIEKLDQDEKNFFNAIDQYFKKLNITVNYTDVALGVNQELNLVTDANGLACVGTILPTVDYLQTVMSTIENFQFGMTFEYIKPLIDALNSFDSLCQPAYNAYAGYFLYAYEAYQSNKNVFVHTALENLIQNKDVTLSYVLELSSQIGAKDDVSAGETVAKILQLALANWLPQ